MLNKGDAQSYAMLGAVYAAEQKFDDARAQFEIAASKDPKEPDPIFQIAQTYAQQNNIPMALQQIVTRARARSQERAGAGLQGRSLRASSTMTTKPRRRTTTRSSRRRTTRKRCRS